MAPPQVATGPGVQNAPPPQHVMEAMQYMQQMAMNMMWNNPHSWQPPYGQDD